MNVRDEPGSPGWTWLIGHVHPRPIAKVVILDLRDSPLVFTSCSAKRQDFVPVGASERASSADTPAMLRLPASGTRNAVL